MQTLFGRFPNILSRFVMAYGINTLLDPVWMLIVDTALKRYAGAIVEELIFEMALL